jgi:hypothetical protein
MERDSIERLAMDVALGELSEDATALFEAYLATHPQAEQWARQMQQTCATAQTAIAAKTRVLYGENLAAGRPFRRIRQISGPALGRWAAVVVLALLVGAVAGRWSGRRGLQPGASVRTAVVRAEPTAGGWRQLVSEPGPGFWQAKALALLESAPSVPSGPRSGESLWERHRHYRKED